MIKLRKNSGFTLIELLVVISIILILVSFVVPQIGGARAKARLVKCANNLRVIGSALIMYADNNGGAFPGDLSGLYPSYVGDHMTFDCPSTSGEPTVASGTVTSADYVYQPGLSDESSGGTPVAADADGNHSNGRNVLFATGSVRFVETADLGTGDGQVDLTAVTETVGS
jgi:prepilin-type N-terminal cleavage/methylation domain-containing protein